MFKLSISYNNIFCIEINNPSPNVRDFIKISVTEKRTDQPAYITAKRSNPSLKVDCPEYMLVEFYGNDPTPFVNYLNDYFKIFKKKRQLGLI